AGTCARSRASASRCTTNRNGTANVGIRLSGSPAIGADANPPPGSTSRTVSEFAMPSAIASTKSAMPNRVPPVTSGRVAGPGPATVAGAERRGEAARGAARAGGPGEAAGQRALRVRAQEGEAGAPPALQVDQQRQVEGFGPGPEPPDHQQAQPDPD